ncbi:MAG: TIGR00180 family glycosyltransferase [Bacteroidota bacterium]
MVSDNCLRSDALGDLISIIVPTKYRPTHLNRTLAYYRKFDVPIFIADAANDPKLNIVTSERIRYLHLPNLDFSEQVLLGLELVQTPFAVLCADDDFATLGGVSSCVDFLMKSQDYDSCQGRYLIFEVIKGEVFACSYYDYSSSIDINSDNVRERLMSGVKPYMQLLYAVHRTSTLKACFTSMRKHKNNLMEVGQTLISLMHGKSKVLDVFYGVREIIPGSWGQTTLNLSEVKKRNQDEYRNWLRSLSAHLKNITHIEDAECDSILESALADYFYFEGSFRTWSRRQKLNLKNSFPKPMIDFYIRTIRPMRTRAKYQAMQRMHNIQNVIRTPEARQEWEKILDDVKKFYELS